MASRYLHIKDWLVVLVVQLCLVRSSADYVWDGSEWKWQDTPANPIDDTAEGSTGYSHDGMSYGEDDDDDREGSGRDDFETEVVREEHAPIDHKDVINVDEEIDPRDIDIGFHDESTQKPTPKSTTPTATNPPTAPTTGSDIHKHHNQDTNFFAQPGILAAVVGGTVVGLLCTILLVMLIVYRMRKADEGSYSLNEPKRSPNVHSYLKAPSREFFA